MTNIELQTMNAVKDAAREYISREIDWEQRRYEIAKEMLPMLYQFGANMIITLGSYEELAEPDNEKKLRDVAIKGAVELTDGLIEELKKTKQ